MLCTHGSPQKRPSIWHTQAHPASELYFQNYLQAKPHAQRVQIGPNRVNGTRVWLLRHLERDWYSSLVQCLPRICQALGSTHGTESGYSDSHIHSQPSDEGGDYSKFTANQGSM